MGYILWTDSAEVFSWGRFTLRWNGLLLILAFVIARLLLIRLVRKQEKSSKEVDVLITFLIAGSLLGARLGHVVFFEPKLWSRPLSIFFPFEFEPSFNFTGMTGFSIHGAVAGIALAVWLFSRRKVQEKNLLPHLDKASLAMLWTLVPIFLGSFLSSDMDGKSTNSPIGTVFIEPVTSGLEKLPCCIMRIPGKENPLSMVVARKVNDVINPDGGHHPIGLFFFFKSGTTETMVDEFLVGDVKTFLYDNPKAVDEPGTEPLHYTIFKEHNGDFEARVRTTGIARYPVQLFESVSSLLLFAFMFWYGKKNEGTMKSGRISGLVMILFWVLEFCFEFLKENQASFIKNLGINKAQVLCIVLIAAGVFLLLRSRSSSPPPIRQAAGKKRS